MLGSTPEHAHKLLEDADFVTFDVISPALDYNYDRKMHDVHRLGMEYEDSLTADERSAFRNLLETLTMYGVVREYIKDLYIQWELVKLSRARDSAVGNSQSTIPRQF